MRRSLRLLGRSTCVFVFLFGLRSAAQTAAFEGSLIADIQFPNGQPLDPADLARALPLKKGQPLRSIDVAYAIDGLFATGRFDDIIVEAEPRARRDRTLCHPERPVSGWRHGGRQGDGFAQSGPGRIAPLAFTGRSFSGRRCHFEAVDRIHRLLQANGFYEAEITPTVDPGNDAQQIFLTFHIQEGKRAKYDTPTITGATKLPDATIIRATGWRLPSSTGGGTSPARTPATACRAF